MNADFDDVVEVGPGRPGEDAAYRLDTTKVRRSIGWTDEIALEEGLKDTIQWMVENHETLADQPREYVHKA